VTSCFFFRGRLEFAMQSAVIATADLSVRPSVRQVTMFCSDELKYDRVVFSVGRTIILVSWEVKFIRIFAGITSREDIKVKRPVISHISETVQDRR